jgi:CBS domain-containing protein
MQSLDTLSPPFDRLTHDQAETLKQHIDVGYFRPGVAIVRQGQASDCLHVIIKGAVEARHGAALHDVLGTGDIFDARAVVHSEASEDFIAAEETLCFLIPRTDVLDLVHRNDGFGAFFYAELSRKLDALSTSRDPRGMDSVLGTRIRDARYREAVFIDGSASLEAAAHVMLEADTDAVFVDECGRIGVVTGLKLTRACMIRRLPLETPVREIAQFEVVSIEADQLLVDALLIMTRSNKRRIAVTADGRYVGLLRDLDLLGLFAGNSQLIPGRIARATSVADLAGAARDIQDQVERLYRQGVRIEAINGIMADLDSRLHGKLFEIIAPPTIREAGCLILMGSEGRGEQSVRTDQDNGLLLARPVPEADLATFRADFTQALESFGFPPCPGNIMVRNPLWSQPLDGFLAQLRAWVAAANGEAAMNLSIFADAAAVAGNADVLAHAKAKLIEMFRGETRLLAEVAKLIDLFSTDDLGVLGTVFATISFRHKHVDLKRDGTFPIIHGVRVLSLEHDTLAGSTRQRAEALVARGALDARFAGEILSALTIFMNLRLSAQIEARHRGRAEATSVVNVATMPTVERDMLRDALRIVRRFRELIRLRYNLTGL